jgi:hypothetical protein
MSKNSDCKVNKDLGQRLYYSEIKRVAQINRDEIIDKEKVNVIYCFSCYEIVNMKNNTVTLASGLKLNLTDKELNYLKDFSKENSCDIDSDDEEIEKTTTVNDTIEYIKDLGIYDNLKDKKLIVEKFDDFLQVAKYEETVGLDRHVRDLFTNFIQELFPESSDDYEKFMKENNIPKIGHSSGNIHDNTIKYYKNINTYLEEHNLKKKFIEFVILFEDRNINKFVNNQINLNIFINKQSRNITVNYNNQILDLSNKHITSIESPDGTSCIPSDCKFLIINSNRIEKLGSSNGVSLLPPTLIELQAASNKISSLVSSDGTSVLPTSLKYINIASNQISSLVSSDGNSVLPPTLKELDISYNKLTTIESNGKLLLPQTLSKLIITRNKLIHKDIRLIENNLQLDQFEAFPTP